MKRLISFQRSDHIPTLLRTKDVSKRKLPRRRDRIRFKPKLSLRIRRMLRSIGHGRNSRKKKTVKSLPRISRFKKKLAKPSSPKKKSLLNHSWISFEAKMTNI